MYTGVVVAGGLKKPCQKGGFGFCKSFRGLTQKDSGGSSGTLGPGSKRGEGEVSLQYLILGKSSLQSQGIENLAYFTPEVPGMGPNEAGSE